MITIKRVFSSILCVALAVTSVFAQIDVKTVSVDYARKRLAVSGSTSDDGQKIGLYASSGGSVAAFLQSSAANGEFSFTCEIDESFVDKDIEIRLSQLGSSGVVKNIYLYRSSDIAEWLAEVNSATDENTLRSVTEPKFNTVLKNLVNVDDFNAYNSEIYKLLVNFKRTYALSVDEYAEDIQKAIAVAKINAMSEAEMKEYFENSENRALFGIKNEPNASAYEKIIKYRADKSSSETVGSTGTGFLSPMEVYWAVCEADAIAKINAAKAAEVRAILSQYSDVFSKASADFNTVMPGVNEVTARSVTGTTVTSLSEIIAKLKAAIAAQRETDLRLNGGGSGGSGGGGGGGSLSGGAATTVGMGSALIKPTPEISAENDGDYSDMQGFEWANEAVMALSKLGIINGTGNNNTFSPNSYVKREEFIKMAVLMLDKYDAAAECSFADTKRDSWFYSYVASALKAGLCTGNGSGFGAGENITRQDMVTILGRALKKENVEFSASGSFKDEESISGYAREFANGFKSLGLISGMPNGDFMPQKFATRAESAVIIYNVYKFLRSK